MRQICLLQQTLGDIDFRKFVSIKQNDRHYCFDIVSFWGFNSRFSNADKKLLDYFRFFFLKKSQKDVIPAGDDLVLIKKHIRNRLKLETNTSYLDIRKAWRNALIVSAIEIESLELLKIYGKFFNIPDTDTGKNIVKSVYMLKVNGILTRLGYPEYRFVY
jgi:hypothetical protein